MNPEDGGLDEVADLSLGDEEGFHFLPQLVVALARVGKERHPLGSFPIQGILQN